MANQEQLALLQNQLNELQNVLCQQNNMIGNFQTAARAQALHNTNPPPQPNSNSLAGEILKQFVKSPVKFYCKVNPRKPILAFDGSNYTEWETLIDRALQHAFVRKHSFLNDSQDNFQLLDLIQNKAVAMLMRSTVDDDLLWIVESHKASLSKELFNILKVRYKKAGRQHKVILVDKILKFASEQSPASKSWLAHFYTIMSNIEQAKITVNKLSADSYSNLLQKHHPVPI
ncbi:hypothetical protein PCASD_00305 [Puccinia coronata f. sp. avenae]|uniref:Uncharacterized protein n=1 Tax=Puccinia coronata f. sp. avenae TaxID=200324 RepID=A0A2N5VN82_9BASI|nr:hypothetical protein PCASD_00305 [Puccinia coronata f. sp. avenae]